MSFTFIYNKINWQIKFISPFISFSISLRLYNLPTKSIECKSLALDMNLDLSSCRTQDHACNICGFICWYRTNYSADSRIYGVLTHNATQWYPNNICIDFFFPSIHFIWCWCYFCGLLTGPGPCALAVGVCFYIRVEIVAVTVLYYSSLFTALCKSLHFFKIMWHDL